MGGSSNKTNRTLALQGASGLTGSAQTLSGAGNQDYANSQQLYNLLWGAPGASSSSPTPQQSFAAGTGPLTNPGTTAAQSVDGLASGTAAPDASAPSGATPTAQPAPATGTGGALTGFLNPASLNVTAPTNNFALANTNENEAAETASQQNAQAIQQNAADKGFGAGAPAGFTQDQLMQNQQALANQEGSNFNTNTQNSYNAANSNFWNAANIANTDTNSMNTAGNTATGGAGNLYSNLYKIASGSGGGQGGGGALGSGKSSLMGAAQGAAGALAA